MCLCRTNNPDANRGEAEGTVIWGPPVIRITSLNPKEAQLETKSYGIDDQYALPLSQDFPPLGL